MMNENRENLIKLIGEAFRGVILEDGIGLYEAQAISSYQTEDIRKLYRQKDETTDWQAISKDMLEECYDSHCFFDAKGMRFHLPAIMIYQLKCEDSEVDVNIVGALIGYWEENKSVRLKERFDILSSEQRNTVRQFLIEMFKENRCLEDEIQKAFKAYWDK